MFFPTSLCGVLVFGSASRPPPPPAASSRPSPTCPHTTCPHTTWHRRSLTHNLSSYNLLLVITQSHNLSSHNLLTHNLSSHNLLTHNLLSHNLLTQNFSTYVEHGSSLCVAGVAPIWHWAGSGGALGSQLTPWTPRLFAWQAWHFHFAWQAWHLVTWIVTLRGRRGTYGTGLTLVARLGLSWRRGRCGFWRGRRGTWWHGPSLCVAGVAGVAGVALGWLWWRAWVSVDAVDAAAFCVAGVALGDMDLHFAWQAWHLATWILTLRGRRGTYTALGSLVARLGLSWRRGRRGFLRGRRGTWWHGPSLCVAGMALGDMDPHFAWQAWHLWHWAGSGGALGSQLTPWKPRLFAWHAWHLVTWTFTLRGRRGTWWHGSSLCVAGVAPIRHWADSGGALGFQLTPWTLRLLAWQVWHLVTWTFTLRGRYGTWWHGSSLCVAGVAPIWHWALWWRAWVSVDAVDAAAFCVAGVALAALGWLSHHLWHITLSHTIFHTPSFTHHLSHTALSHTIFDTLSHTFFHTPLCHTSLCHTLFLSHTIFHTQLCHTPCFATPSFAHHFVPHHLSHTTLSHTLFHTQISHTIFHTTLSHTIFHTPSLTHHLLHTIFDTTLSHTIFHTPLCHTPSVTHRLHTTLSHTIFHTPLCRTPSFTNHLSHTTLSHTIFDTPSFTHRFVTHHLWHTTLSHTIFHTPSLHHHLSHHFVTHHLSHTILSHTTLHIQLVLLLDPPPPPLSFLHCPSRYNICCPLLEEADMWGYPVL